MYVKKIKIGNVELKNNIFLAPMAGVSDLPFRIICRKNGAGLAFTEMVSSKGIFYHDKKTNYLLNRNGEEGLLAVQLFGSDVETMREAAKSLEGKADIIDINMGCPVPKVVKNGDGSKLLCDLDLVYNIVKAVVEVSKVPVSVKIRLGWDEKNIVAVEAAKLIEKARS